MFEMIRGSERGHFDHGWLDTYHTFSFGDYRNHQRMGYRALRVINEDRVAPGQGFGMHPHSDMEIVTIVLSGQLEHQDSMGNGEVLRPGEVQWMSAGTGITHSEFNPSKSESVHLYQIWLRPETRGLAPAYKQQTFDGVQSGNGWQTIASRESHLGGLPIRQDATLSLARLAFGESLELAIKPGRFLWLQWLHGDASVSAPEWIAPIAGVAGDGLAVSEVPALKLVADSEDTLLLAFDLG